MAAARCAIVRSLGGGTEGGRVLRLGARRCHGVIHGRLCVRLAAGQRARKIRIVCPWLEVGPPSVNGLPSIERPPVGQDAARPPHVLPQRRRRVAWGPVLPLGWDVVPRGSRLAVAPAALARPIAASSRSVACLGTFPGGSPVAAGPSSEGGVVQYRGACAGAGRRAGPGARRQCRCCLGVGGVSTCYCYCDIARRRVVCIASYLKKGRDLSTTVDST